ncbi:CBS domain-containing protein [Roseospirillum parvum]|uniref:CBS domain-containing protein n=1 Tax=Roseospirillum parvum TaxID=83401 RepID=A0A1G8AJV3_9PROT|nr:CBS domain-containing protein [Roseospirillum parvum]SDH21221.1 CBS domain-containing protein [Roseospirillum parvum]
MPDPSAATTDTPAMRYRLGDCTPQELLDHADLSERDKLAVLQQWELDAVELLVAEEENMGGGPSPPLAEIRHAMRDLRARRGPAASGAVADAEGATVGAVMSRAVKTVHADNRIADVARQMAADNLGLFVVLDGDAVAGVVTDRDIAVRAVGQGLEVTARPVADIMTNRVVACHHAHPLERAADLMAREGLRRLCVVDDADTLVGLVSLSDLALGQGGDATIGRVLRAITRSPTSGPTEAGRPTSRHTETSPPGGLHVYSLRPVVPSRSPSGDAP